MRTTLHFRTLYHNTEGLKQAEAILARNLTGGMAGLGKLLTSSAQSRMRKDAGDEHRSLQTQIRGKGIDKSLIVFSTLVQAFTDALGLPAGTFPPWGPGTRVFKWAARRARNMPNKQMFTTAAPRQISHLSRRQKGRARVLPVTRTRRIKGQRFTTEQIRQARDKNIKRLAFVVARNIYEKGIRPTYWHDKTLEANKARIVQQVANALTRGVNEINRTTK